MNCAGMEMDSNDFNADTRRRIAEMLEKIHREKLLNRIYRFTKYIYLHRDGTEGIKRR